MKSLVLCASLLLGLTGCVKSGLENYKNLVRADVPVPPSAGVRVTYLGVNGYLLQSADATVLVDPYFTRIPPVPYLTSSHLVPDDERIRWGLRQVLGPSAHVDLILVTHAHPDHIFDVRPIAQKTGARIVASPTGCNLLRAFSNPPPVRLEPILTPAATHGQPDGARQQTRRFGRVTVQALEAEHDRLFGFPLYAGLRAHVPAEPKSATDWVCGEPLSYIVTMGGQRIFIAAGGISGPQQAGLAPVDLAIVGAALPDAQQCFRKTVDTLRPRYILPSHQDDFFIAPERGFHFGPKTDFGFVLRELKKTPDLTGRVILLDYFRPWTLR